MMWFFILTVFLNQPNPNNVIIKVGGFPDAQACEVTRRAVVIEGSHGYSVTICQQEAAKQ